jgi:hypothetical protein
MEPIWTVRRGLHCNMGPIRVGWQIITEEIVWVFYIILFSVRVVCFVLNKVFLQVVYGSKMLELLRGSNLRLH